VAHQVLGALAVGVALATPRRRVRVALGGLAEVVQRGRLAERLRAAGRVTQVHEVRVWPLLGLVAVSPHTGPH
jgi:hypothetical protein